MGRYAWASQVYVHPEIMVGFDGDTVDQDPKKARVSSARNRRGRPLASDDFFEALVATGKSERKPQDVALANGNFLIVSPAAIETISRFDLGQGGFYPTRFLSKDRKSELPIKHQFWNVGNVKDTFVTDQNAKFQQANYGNNDPDEDLFSPPIVLEEDQTVLSAAALDGPDIWVERRVDMLVFVSGALGDALIAAGFGDCFRLVRCAIY